MGTNMPSKNNPALIWLEAHIETWTANVAAIGLSAAQTSELTARIETARQSVTAIETARAQALALTRQYDFEATAMRTYAARMVADIKAYAANQSDPGAVYVSAGVVPAKHRSPKPAPEQPYVTNSELHGNGAVTIHFNARGPTGTVWEVTRKLANETVYRHVGHADVATKSFTDRTLPSSVNSAQYMIRGVRGSTVGLSSNSIGVGFGTHSAIASGVSNATGGKAA